MPTTTHTFDWIIVGAGPAGSTLARLLAPLGKVLLLDRRPLDRPWLPGQPGKCCGGLLAPDAQRALAQFRLALPEKVLGGPQLFAVRALDLTSGRERLYQRFYLNLDREAFDRHLVELALEAGIRADWEAEFLSFEAGTVRYRCQGTVWQASCRYLIAADGAAGTVRQRVAPAGGTRFAHTYVAIQEECERINDSPFFSAYFDAKFTDFYAWSIPKRDTLLLGAAFTPDGLALRKFQRLKLKLEARGLKFGPCRQRTGAMLRRPQRTGDFWPGEKNVFAVGEAAGLVSPSSAEGLSYAFRSAAILAELFQEEETPTLGEYQRKLWKLRLDLQAKILKIPLLYSPSIRKWLLTSGISAIPIKSHHSHY